MKNDMWFTEPNIWITEPRPEMAGREPRTHGERLALEVVRSLPRPGAQWIPAAAVAHTKAVSSDPGLWTAEDDPKLVSLVKRVCGGTGALTHYDPEVEELREYATSLFGTERMK